MWALEIKSCNGPCAPVSDEGSLILRAFLDDFPRRRPQPAQPLNTVGYFGSCQDPANPEGILTGDESSACWARDSNRHFRRAEPRRPPNPPRRASTSAVRAEATT